MNIYLWASFETAINLFESYIIVDFVSKVQTYKYFDIKRYIGFIAAVFISFFELNIMNHMVLFEGVAIFIPIITIFTYSYFFLNGDVFRKMFISMLVMVGIIVINSLTAFLISIFTGIELKDLIAERTIYRLFTVILTKIIFLLLTRMSIRYLKSNHNYSLDRMEWCALLFSPTISIFFCVQIISIMMDFILVRKKLYYVLFLFICIVLVNMANYYLFLKIGKNNKSKEELTLLQQRQCYQMKNIDNIRRTYNEMKTLRHDLKNNMFCILALLEQGYYDKATEYAQSISQKINDVQTFEETDNDAINCIINIKMKSAKSYGIDFSYDVEKELGKINEVDTCILIANLLDNAIEACNNIQSGGKKIKITIFQSGGSTFITVKNSIEKSVLKYNPALITTKQNDKLHGLGSKSIRAVVNRYNGNLKYYEKDGFFCCKTRLNFLKQITS